MRNRWLIAAGLAAAVGCGGPPPPADVTGTVTLDGQPLADGEVVFVAADGASKPASGKVAAGAFKLKVAPGPKKVLVTASKPGGPTDKVMGGGPGMVSALPERYNTKTELTAEVRPDRPTAVRFELKSAP